MRFGGDPSASGDVASAPFYRRRDVFRAGTVLVAGIWLVLRTIYFNGFYLEDSPGYVTDAAYLALGEFRARDYITGLNVGIFAPVGLALALFGKTEAAISLWPLACSLLGMASMVAAVGVLCGRRWGCWRRCSTQRIRATSSSRPWSCRMPSRQAG